MKFFIKNFLLFSLCFSAIILNTFFMPSLIDSKQENIKSLKRIFGYESKQVIIKYLPYSVIQIVLMNV
jgi:hypothetical protein